MRFHCSHTKEELENESKEQYDKKEPPRHICEHRDGSKKEGIVRFKNDEKESIVFNDGIKGEVKFDPSLLGDFSIAKSESEALYNFAVVCG